ncbi:AAA family ATPase [bacterium]|nr:AAA family ATPase [bacterium]
MSKKVNLPTIRALQDACITAIEQLGGSANNREIDMRVAEILKLTDEQLKIPHQGSKGSRTEYNYRMAWVRTSLKKQGLINNPVKGTWNLTNSEKSEKIGRKKNTELVAKDKKRTNDNRLIHQVMLQNLLSFGPDTPPLELENLNVLIGPNGCGKSNFIEAIAIMRSTPGDFQTALRNAGGASDIAWKGNPNNNSYISIITRVLNISLIHYISLESKWSSVTLKDEIIADTKRTDEDGQPLVYFQHGKQKSLIRTKQNDEWILREVELDSANPALGQIKDASSYPHLFFLGHYYNQIRIYRDWSFGRDTIFRLPQKADMPNDHLMEDFSNLGMYLNRLRRNVPAKKAVIAGLQDLYEGIDDFDVKIDGGTVQVIFFEGNFVIPATRLSDGTLRYLCLMAILHDPEPPPLICIEEPELGLHPDILPSLADHLISASERTQLIVTTHSDILVDAMSERPECVVVCEKHDGKTEMKRLDRESLQVWLDKYRLGQLWLDGEIGGKRW